MYNMNNKNNNIIIIYISVLLSLKKIEWVNNNDRTLVQAKTA